MPQALDGVLQPVLLPPADTVQKLMKYLRDYRVSTGIKEICSYLAINLAGNVQVGHDLVVCLDQAGENSMLISATGDSAFGLTGCPTILCGLRNARRYLASCL
ncbi:MAG: hypothetical protein R3A13_03125 [Bdellovibrionota bacterium]